MKYLFTILTLALFVSASYGKEKDSVETRFDRGYKNAISMHSGGVIPFFSSTKNLYPYRFMYRRYNGRNAFRVGVRTDLNLIRNLDFETDGEPQNRTNSYSFRIGAGYERYVPLKGRFTAYYGAELFNFTNLNRIVENGPNFSQTTNNNSTRFGVSPLIGIEFAFNPRFSLSLEMAYSLSLGINKVRQETTTNGVQTSTTNTSTNLVGRMHRPKGITFRWNF